MGVIFEKIRGELDIGPSLKFRRRRRDQQPFVKGEMLHFFPLFKTDKKILQAAFAA